jgi:hypothetical protein
MGKSPSATPLSDKSSGERGRPYSKCKNEILVLSIAEVMMLIKFQVDPTDLKGNTFLPSVNVPINYQIWHFYWINTNVSWDLGSEAYQDSSGG